MLVLGLGLGLEPQVLVNITGLDPVSRKRLAMLTTTGNGQTPCSSKHYYHAISHLLGVVS